MKTKLNEYVGAGVEHMTQKKRVPEDYTDEYFLITWYEGGDEIHFMLMDMVHYDVVEKHIPTLFNNTKDRNFQRYLEGFLEYCNANQTKPKGLRGNFWVQTYCEEPWPYEGYPIVRIISIPEFGS